GPNGARMEARAVIASSRTPEMTPPAWAIQAGGRVSGPTVRASGLGTGFLLRPCNRTSKPLAASASASPTPTRPGPMIPSTGTATDRVRPRTLVPVRAGRLRHREGEEVLGRLGAARQSERGPHLPVLIPLSPHLGRAAEHVACDLVAQVLRDDFSGAREDAVRHRHAARAHPLDHFVSHVGRDHEGRTLHAPRRLDLECVGRAHVLVGRDLVAQGPDERELRRVEGIWRYGQIRPDGTPGQEHAHAIRMRYLRGAGPGRCASTPRGPARRDPIY